MLGLQSYLQQFTADSSVLQEEEEMLGFDTMLSQEAIKLITRLNPIAQCVNKNRGCSSVLDEHELAMLY